MAGAPSPDQGSPDERDEQAAPAAGETAPDSETAASSESNEQPTGDEDDPLTYGNPLRPSGLLLVVPSALAAVVLMASSLSSRLVVPVGMLLAVLATVGMLITLGSFADDEAQASVFPTAQQLLRPLLWTAGAALALLLALRAAVAGMLPQWLSATLIPIAFLLLVVGVYRTGERLGPWRLDEQNEPRSLGRRHGFWLVVATTLLYLPMLGNHSLSDPWETHYGEVAREVLARNDWISLWWAQEGWFWSKPVLSFWIQAISMALLGVRYEPGQMLSGVHDGWLPQPEWAVRFPIFILTLLGVYFLYKGVARSHGRRAGLWGGLVLLSMPQFFLVAHQSMTDMPFVACMAAAVGLFLYASQLDPQEQVKRYALKLGPLSARLSLFHAVVGAVMMLALPQIFYLLSRHVYLQGTAPFVSLARDAFSSGSPLNCGLPSNAACQDGLKAVVVNLHPGLQAVNWLLVLALLLWLCWGERRRQRLVFLAAWLFASLATMAKGPAGLLLPALAALAYVVGTRRYRDLTRMEIAAGLLVFAVTVLPWFVAMYARHGQPFVDRLLFHDMFKRAFRHVHDTNTGDDVGFRYYVWQLGYATFPWVGLVPIALVQWLRGRRDERAFGGALLLAGWFLTGFVLFSAMGTKFHHYCLPLVPPLAMLTGVLLDEVWRSRKSRSSELRMVAASCMGGALVTALVGRDLFASLPGALSQIRLLHLFTYNYQRPWPESLDFRPALLLFTIAAALCTAALAVHRLRGYALIALSALSLAFCAWGLNVYLVQASPHWGQRELFMRYEQEQRTRPGTLVAYQMNWKGENFYRGNALPAFVSSGDRFTKWIDGRKRAGERTFYFVTEHKRADYLSRELGRPEVFEVLTDQALNNKFGLIRVRFDGSSR